MHSSTRIKQKTLPQLEPLELIIQRDFIWSYGGYEPKIPIPTVLNEITNSYYFIGHIGDRSIETDLLTMLLNMHDYNHQNGTHRDLFRITDVEFHQFIDNGHHSHAFYDMPTAPYTLAEKLRKPDLMLLPSTIKAHLENHFPSLVIFMEKCPSAKQHSAISLCQKQKTAPGLTFCSLVKLSIQSLSYWAERILSLARLLWIKMRIFWAKFTRIRLRKLN